MHVRQTGGLSFSRRDCGVTRQRRIDLSDIELASDNRDQLILSVDESLVVLPRQSVWDGSSPKPGNSLPTFVDGERGVQSYEIIIPGRVIGQLTQYRICRLRSRQNSSHLQRISLSCLFIKLLSRPWRRGRLSSVPLSTFSHSQRGGSPWFDICW